MSQQQETALLAIHWQNDVLHPDGKIRAGFEQRDPRRGQVLSAAKKLLVTARENAVPVVFLRIAFRHDFADLPENCLLFRRVAGSDAMIEGSWGAAFHEGLEPAPDEWIVTHNRINGFYASQLEAQLSALQVRNLVVAGVATHSSVEHTVRHAADMGFNLLLVEEACSSTPIETHRSSIKVLSSLATIATLGEACDLMKLSPQQ